MVRGAATGARADSDAATGRRGQRTVLAVGGERVARGARRDAHRADPGRDRAETGRHCGRIECGPLAARRAATGGHGGPGQPGQSTEHGRRGDLGGEAARLVQVLRLLLMVMRMVMVRAKTETDARDARQTAGAETGRHDWARCARMLELGQYAIVLFDLCHYSINLAALLVSSGGGGRPGDGTAATTSTAATHDGAPTGDVVVVGAGVAATQSDAGTETGERATDAATATTGTQAGGGRGTFYAVAR
uniref:Uncharacterized protein n=1 Tax=Anopheles albimanus TaxID=7167 RepID=A0A182FXD1_ANOAL